MRHAWFSAKAAARFGYYTCISRTGEQIKATATSSDRNFENSYRWSDKVYLGLVYDELMCYHSVNAEQHWSTTNVFNE